MKAYVTLTDEIIAKTNQLLEAEVKLCEELEANLKDLNKSYNKQKKRLHAAEELVKQFSTLINETFNSFIGETKFPAIDILYPDFFIRQCC